MRHSRSEVVGRATRELELLDHLVTGLAGEEWELPLHRPETRDPWTVNEKAPASGARGRPRGTTPYRARSPSGRYIVCTTCTPSTNGPNSLRPAIATAEAVSASSPFARALGPLSPSKTAAGWLGAHP